MFKEIHNVKRECRTEEDKFKELKAQFNDATAVLKREKKQPERKLKKQEEKDFVNNLKAETNNFSFECEVCDLKIETNFLLKFHMRTIHMNSVNSQTDDKDPEDKVTQTDANDFNVDKSMQTEVLKSNETFIKYLATIVAQK